MGLEALQWDNLVRIAKEAKEKYVDFNKQLPGQGNCGKVEELVAERLYAQLGQKYFDKYVHSARFKVEDNRTHFLIVVGREKISFQRTFNMGLKIDPSIYQFRDIHPELDQLNRQLVFDGDYPKIYNTNSIIESKSYAIIAKAIKMRARGCKI